MDTADFKIKTEKITKWILENKWFCILFGILLLILVWGRSAPYFLYGPFGFGYDTGIYKKSFEDIKNFSDIFSSQLSIFPSFLAYLMNLLRIPMGFLLYGAHIFMSVFLVIPLYILTREYFGKYAGIVTTAIFTISYVQVFASEFYLFKAVMGAIFMLYAFIYFARKSYLFYIFAGLLTLTQLPQLVLLAFGVGVATIFEWKKYLKFNLIGLGIIALGLLFIFLTAPQQLTNARDIVLARLNGETAYDLHQAGLFMPSNEFFIKEFILIVFGFAGVISSFRKKEVFPVLASLIFVSVIVLGKIFFENRFVMELELLLIPFGAFMIVRIFEKILIKKIAKIAAAILIIAGSFSFTLHYFSTTYPSLTKYEIIALESIKRKNDVRYIFVTNTFYATWAYGFSGKEVLAPGIFNNVWNFEEFIDYQKSSKIKKIQKLLNLARKYGKYYYFEGERQKSDNLKDSSPFIREIYQLGDVRISEISNPDE